MRKHYSLALLVLCVCWGNLALAQTISGEVYDKAQQTPISGATVIAAKTKNGTVTDENGKFTIELKGDKFVQISFAGYAEARLSVTSATFYRVELEASSLDQVVVVGYGTQKKANLTGAVSTVDVKKTFGSRPITDVSRALQGVVPGLTITTASGDLGTDPKIQLRGLSGSLNTGATGAKPLILVDNVEIPSLQMINPDDIESISVLKDAASASIYGTRGAFGVILITTKSARKGQPTRVSYTNNFAWSKAINLPKLAGGVDNATAALEALKRLAPGTVEVPTVGFYVDSLAIVKMREWEQTYGGQDLPDEMVYGRDFEFRNSKLYFYRTWDPNKKFLQDWTMQQRHDISISGGSEKTSYNLGLGYLDQGGQLKVNPDDFQRYNLTLGVNSSIAKWVDIRGKVMYSNTRVRTPYTFQDAHYNQWYYLYRWPSYYPYGTYEGKPFRSAVTEAAQANLDVNKNLMNRISFGATFKVLPGLTIDADYTYTSTNRHLNQTGGNTYAYEIFAKETSLRYYGYQPVAHNRARWQSAWTDLSTGKAYATYVKNYRDDHHFKVIAGSDIEMFKSNAQTSERGGLISPDYGSLDLTTGTPIVDGQNSWWSTLGFFGRINYDYKNKFLLELNGRYDGSSRFPVNDLWGFFPSVSAGYVLTEEAFMDAIKPTLSFLKLRASYGSVGNQVVGGNRFLSLMSSSNSGWLLPSTGNQVTLSVPKVVSPRLTWETVKTIDFGADARFLDNKLGISFDWYQRTTSDMVTTGVTLPSSFGTIAPVQNFGELTGKGWELAVDYNHTFSNGINFSITGTLSDALEKITKYAGNNKSIPNTIPGLVIVNGNYYEGMTIGEIWGFETDRLFTADDFGTDGKLKAGIPTQFALQSGAFIYGSGDIKYRDLDGNDSITIGRNSADAPGDKKIIGNSSPRYQYGIRLNADWQGFDISLFLQGVAKRDFWGSGSIMFPGYRATEGWFAHQMDYWTPTNTDAFYPRPAEYGATIDRWNFQPQTKYMLNLAYLRVKNLSLGYTLSKKVLDRLHVSRTRFYVSAENLYTWDNLNGVPIDPEIDFTQAQVDRDRAGFGRAYPYRMTLSAGLQVTF